MLVIQASADMKLLVEIRSGLGIVVTSGRKRHIGFGVEVEFDTSLAAAAKI